MRINVGRLGLRTVIRLNFVLVLFICIDSILLFFLLLMLSCCSQELGFCFRVFGFVCSFEFLFFSCGSQSSHCSLFALGSSRRLTFVSACAFWFSYWCDLSFLGRTRLLGILLCGQRVDCVLPIHTDKSHGDHRGCRLFRT